MRDLFGSTKYIKFGVLETILSSSNAVSDLLKLEGLENNLEEDFSFLDYVSNLDSYLYGLIILPPEDIKKLSIWLNNYINNLYIPLLEKDSLYLVKSKLISEIFKLKTQNSKIDPKLKNTCLRVLDTLENVSESYKKEIEISLEKRIDDEHIKDYLKIYNTIYNDNCFLKKMDFKYGIKI